MKYEWCYQLSNDKQERNSKIFSPLQLATDFLILTSNSIVFPKNILENSHAWQDQTLSRFYSSIWFVSVTKYFYNGRNEKLTRRWYPGCANLMRNVVRTLRYWRAGSGLHVRKTIDRNRRAWGQNGSMKIFISVVERTATIYKCVKLWSLRSIFFNKLPLMLHFFRYTNFTAR